MRLPAEELGDVTSDDLGLPRGRQKDTRAGAVTSGTVSWSKSRR